jgi:hypothetical protein
VQYQPIHRFSINMPDPLIETRYLVMIERLMGNLRIEAFDNATEFPMRFLIQFIVLRGFC